MWTQENTEGYSDAELAVVNRVLERVMRDGEGLESYSINDAISNSLYPGITEAELERDVRLKLGLPASTPV